MSIESVMLSNHLFLCCPLLLLPSVFPSIRVLPISWQFASGGFPGGSDGKESTCNVGDLGLIPGLGRSPGEGKSYPLQYSGLENSMGSIVLGGLKEEDTTKRLPVHFTSLSGEEKGSPLQYSDLED